MFRNKKYWTYWTFLLFLFFSSSGQKEIYDAKGNIVKINPDFAAVAFNETSAYILDTKTNLKYEKPAVQKKYTFDEGLRHVEDLNAASYGGINNWRLPTIDELRFIADYSKKSPAVFDIFESYVSSDFYWASEQNGQRAWAIYFGYGCAVPLKKIKIVPVLQFLAALQI